jgi:hypothetical protein
MDLVGCWSSFSRDLIQLGLTFETGLHQKGQLSTYSALKGFQTIKLSNYQIIKLSNYIE